MSSIAILRWKPAISTLGRFGFTANTSPAGSLRGDIKLQGANFDAVGSVPLGDKFSLFARAGLNYAHAKDSFAGTGSVAVIDPSPQQMGRQLQIRIRRRNTISLALSVCVSRRNATESTMPSATRETSICIRRDSCSSLAAQRHRHPRRRPL